ncbi:4-amino-4-deoxy-L-arabinose-phosphoundecaprenol flippase subunit ArnF [Legionella steigerwaltii]|uniref:4-amino-4-deoxy-L-arabinose-phosphoundecaprenol flippase subunit ArnF n=1 Tax=Legionella steigerwaltii TaxID=460 RepID=A0A378L479_9GAMM|nr:EamA family transporter [Legionella steigerwaltii]KTD77115.1 4-amino-4-deoxy-L-arabinose-phosphoundecaprenol flippase subunit ArnF [Legionella steigerwaltii]STY21606.1 4-amino-4-deoxy-L-arabinose-phosphoundecaprenol flippase subunit ArnF [Legionella steigerwaltii]
MILQATFVNYSYIVLTILCTVYAQLVIRWQMKSAGALPPGFLSKIMFVFLQFLNPWIVSVVFASTLAIISWMAAMTKFEISYAYPFLSLSFIFVLIFSSFILGESLNIYKIAGTILVTLGVMVTFKG